MINKILVTGLILQGFLIHILVLNLYAEELLEKGTSDRSNVESRAPISVQTLKDSYFLSNHINQFSNYNLNALSRPSYKSPWVAFLLSYINPGSGQIYNGEITKGLVFTGTILFGAGIALIPAIGATSGSDWLVSSYSGTGIAGIAYIWQLIDAPVLQIE